MNIKLFFLKVKMKLFPFFSKPYDFNLILKESGIDVGEHTIFYDPMSMTIDRQRPWMLKIGDYCKITHGSVILTHDYSRSVLRRAYGEIIGEAAMTTIGDNVFIGINSIVLMGAHIGNNVIIGAGSVVHGTIPDNCVAAGNPCKVICSLEEYKEKRKAQCLSGAVAYYCSFYRKNKRKPSISEMGPFFHLFLPREVIQLKANKISLKWNGDEEEEVLNSFINSQGPFKDYDDFCQFADKMLKSMNDGVSLQ